jgi:hypothetical protein
MIERIRETPKTVLIIGKDLIKYFFPHSGEPDHMTKPQKNINPYIKFVQSKNIIDILHQIVMLAHRGKQKELNVYFRSALEAILIHVDNTGEFDLKYQEKI